MKYEAAIKLLETEIESAMAEMKVIDAEVKYHEYEAALRQERIKNLTEKAAGYRTAIMVLQGVYPDVRTNQ